MSFEQRNHRRGRGLVSIAAIATAVLLAGCSALTPSSAPKSNGATTVSTSVPKDKVTITVSDWDNSDSIKMIIAAFEKKYPQVTVKHQFTDAANFQKTIKLVMQGSNPPDIIQYNTPVRDLGAAGLILDLTPYEKAYNWDGKVAKSLLDQTRFSKDGKVMGEGALLAAPISVPVVGVFYNKKLTSAAGVTSVPSTFSEFDADLAKVKAAGTLPLQMGSLDFGGIHNWAAVLNAFAAQDTLRNWMNGDAGASIDNAATVKATTAFQGWAAKGYYPASANGTSDVDAAANFASGKSAYLIDGSWQAGGFQQKLGSDVGFYPLPMQNAGDPLIANASVAAYSVSAKTKHATAAVAFLNFLYSAEAAPGVTVTGNASVVPASNKGFTGVGKEVADVFSKVAESNGAMIFPDQAAPALLDVLTSNIQLVVAGKMTPAAFASSIQATWAGYHN